MIANLFVMVLVGGYETFVSRLNLQDHRDQPEWLSYVNAGVLRVKLAIYAHRHLLDSFAQKLHRRRSAAQKVIVWQVTIHLAFVLSALLLAVTDRHTTGSTHPRRATAANAGWAGGGNPVGGPCAE